MHAFHGSPLRPAPALCPRSVSRHQQLTEVEALLGGACHAHVSPSVVPPSVVPHAWTRGRLACFRHACRVTEGFRAGQRCG